MQVPLLFLGHLVPPPDDVEGLILREGDEGIPWDRGVVREHVGGRGA